jgi:hypothetical protein
MGWLFSERWLERKDLIKHLVENKGGAKVIRHCCVGNDLWMVVEYERNGMTERSIVLCMMQGPTRSKNYDGRDKNWWGYKDLDESGGPYKLSCPESYLTMCTAPPNQYAYEWRQRVYALNAKKREARKNIVVGAKLMYGGVVYQVTKLLGARGYQVDGYKRMKRTQAENAIFLGVA